MALLERIFQNVSKIYPRHGCCDQGSILVLPMVQAREEQLILHNTPAMLHKGDGIKAMLVPT